MREVTVGLCLQLTGALMLIAGVALLNPTAGLITAGVILIALGVVNETSTNRHLRPHEDAPNVRYRR
jgi:hypothetical protein